MQRYKVTVVNYLNSKPFIYGIEQSDLFRDVQLLQEYPSQCAESLINGDTDVALIPAAMILRLKEPHIVSRYCIGADGPVQTVCVFSEVPIEQADNVYLDYQSSTSVRLFQVLAKEYWSISPRWVKAYPGYTSEIKGTTAGVLIGDRTIPFLDKYPYIYNLGEIWKQHTGLPFVFAAWVASFRVEQEFVDRFDMALTAGLQQRDLIAERNAFLNSNVFSVKEYYRQYIDYELDEKKKESLHLFLRKVSELEQWLLPEITFQV